MRNWLSGTLSKWFHRRPAVAIAWHTAAPARAPGATDLPRYPPSDPGIQSVPLASIITSQDELIQRIFRTSGFSRQDFARLVEPAVRNLAAYVHLLPATATANHCGQGGLYRFALELGLYALQAANATIFPVNGGVERRFRMRPRWCLATLLAGMCSQIHRPINDLAVFTETNERWPAFLEPLFDWLMRVNASTYYVRWMEGASASGARASAAYLIDRIVPKEVLQFLAEENGEIIPVMTAAISGADGANNQINGLLGPLTARVIDEDLKHSAINYGRFSVGFHLEPHLIDAMRQLVHGGAWSCNVTGGVLWAGSDGVFLDWEPAAQDLVRAMTRARFVGVPKDPGTLADILFEADVFVRTHGGGRYWTIECPTGGGGTIGVAAKFSDKGLIFPPHFDFTPFDAVCLSKSSRSVAPSRAKAPRAGAHNPPAAAAIPFAQPQAERAIEPVGNTPPEETGRSGELFPDLAVEAGVPGAAEGDAVEPPAAGERAPGAAEAQKPERKPRASKPRKPATQRHAPEGDRAAEIGAPGEAPEAEEAAEAPSGQWSPSAGAQARLKALKDPSAWLLRQIIGRFKAGLTGDAVAVLAQGVGITREELSAHGQSPLALIDELATLQWLWVDTAKPMRRLHTIGQKPVLILKMDVARDLELIGGNG